MRVPVDWLQALFDEELPELGQLTDLLSGLGLSVETVHDMPPAPEGVLVARVDEVEPIAGTNLRRVMVSHPGATVQVVCGAPNVAPGMLSALARPGASLPGVPGEIGVRSIQGVESDGMLGSPRELGLFDSAAGIVTFGADVTPGAPLAELWPAQTVIELELTPNRADAFSMLGVARDLGAKLGWKVRHPAAGLELGDPTRDDGLSLDVQDEQGSPRFTLRLIEGVEVAPSPVWLQHRLAALGLRPRNNVVDVTNYVTFELGQPSHAYDLRALTRGTVQVRRARQGEALDLLNEQSIELSTEDLVIATPGEGDSSSEAIGLAGVMGGLHDSVRRDTTSVALEVALFDPVTVRKSAKRHKLVTDARTRFERGVDPNLQPLASARAAYLIAEVSGGTVHPGITATGRDVSRQSVDFRPDRVAFLMGFDVDRGLQETYLQRLGCVVDPMTDGAWRVTPPSWRYDLSIEEDLVEEVARLHGYEHIGSSVPAMRFVPPATDPTHRLLKQRIAALGFQETITYVFTGEQELERSRAPGAVSHIENPQGADRAVLRTSLLTGLLGAAVTNRGEEALALFEVGRVFVEREEERLALLMRGPTAIGTWRDDVPGDFYAFKGRLEELAGLAGVTLELAPHEHPQLHPGVSAQVVWAGEVIGQAGRLHPEIEAAYELPPTYFAEVALPLGERSVRFEDFSRQPHAERDLAVIAPHGATYASLRELCASAAGPLLVSLEPFDVYAGSQLPAGMRSVALRFRFRHTDRALTDTEVDAAMVNVISAVRDAGYDIRA